MSSTYTLRCKSLGPKPKARSRNKGRRGTLRTTSSQKVSKPGAQQRGHAMWVQQIARHWPAPCPKKLQGCTRSPSTHPWRSLPKLVQALQHVATATRHRDPRAKTNAYMTARATRHSDNSTHLGRVLTRWARRAQSSTPKSQSIDRWSARGKVL